ncbi:MAG: hypothetical protein J7599_08360 [Niabella sp.]|nr:hypothetical protein [Niabella sp.]
MDGMQTVNGNRVTTVVGTVIMCTMFLLLVFSSCLIATGSFVAGMFFLAFGSIWRYMLHRFLMHFTGTGR